MIPVLTLTWSLRPMHHSPVLHCTPRIPCPQERYLCNQKSQEICQNFIWNSSQTNATNKAEVPSLKMMHNELRQNNTLYGFQDWSFSIPIQSFTSCNLSISQTHSSPIITARTFLIRSFNLKRKCFLNEKIEGQNFTTKHPVKNYKILPIDLETHSATSNRFKIQHNRNWF